MPYLGNTPSTSFATVVKDSFSGDGSTVAFTLSKVATTNSVSVFVENVRQEPTTAYAVSGTTLTFTAAPVTSSGNNIYVLHMNPTTTTTHPSAQALTATSGTFTSDLTVDTTTLKVDSANNRVGIGTASPDTEFHVKGAGTVMNIEGTGGSSFIGLKDSDDGTVGFMGVDGGSIKFQTSGGSYSDKLVIDSNGHVTMPLQSSFLASFGTANTNIALNSAVHQYFDTEVYDINGDYASNTFTAPVTGKYLLQVRVRIDNLPTDPAYMWFYMQTSNRVHTVDFFDPDNFDGGGVYYTVQGTIIADMDASDTATFNIHQSGGSQVTDIDSGFFSGHLLG